MPKKLVEAVISLCSKEVEISVDLGIWRKLGYEGQVEEQGSSHKD